MATLKISDLSVGDWVGIDQAELNMPSTDLAAAYIEKLLKPIWVKGISEDSDTVLAGIETVDGWGSIMLKCEYLKPIPITAEMLEKNGFERLLGRDLFYHSESGLEVAFEDGEWMHTINLHEYTIHTISGLHHIQHLLRFYGCEEEINL